MASCSSGIGYKEYFNFFNQFDEGSSMVFVDGDITYSLQFRPAEFLALNHIKSDSEINADKISKTISDYEQGLNFCLRISSVKNEDILDLNTKDKGEYYGRIAMLNVDFPRLIAGISKKDTMRCQIHHYERTYKVQPFVQVLFNIKSNKENLPENVVFYDDIFNEGKKIEFKNFKEYYSNLPKLNI
ncbi:MAG: hypothetical protein COA58_13460 [Bacteroidetes bacterium]|nr:MAG: hypothetical protein COA58_13460 [Bacteroidota bacterium]